jgi:hypothetical protein
MARDHPKKAYSSSKNKSNNDESLSTRKSETVLLSPSDKCTIRITRFIRFACNKIIKMQPKLHASSDLPKKLKARAGIEVNIMRGKVSPRQRIYNLESSIRL